MKITSFLGTVAASITIYRASQDGGPLYYGSCPCSIDPTLVVVPANSIQGAATFNAPSGIATVGAVTGAAPIVPIPGSSAVSTLGLPVGSIVLSNDLKGGVSIIVYALPVESTVISVSIGVSISAGTTVDYTSTITSTTTRTSTLTTTQTVSGSNAVSPLQTSSSSTIESVLSTSVAGTGGASVNPMSTALFPNSTTTSSLILATTPTTTSSNSVDACLAAVCYPTNVADD